MPEGAKIDRIEDLRPGDVLVLPSAEGLEGAGMPNCILRDCDLVLCLSPAGELTVPCECGYESRGFDLGYFKTFRLLEYFTLKRRSGGEICPPAVDPAHWLEVEASANARNPDWASSADCMLRQIGATTIFEKALQSDWDGTDGLGSDEPFWPVYGSRWGRFRDMWIAVGPAGECMVRPDGEGWTRVEFPASQATNTLCGAQATSLETPINLERAHDAETPNRPARDMITEMPGFEDRDITPTSPTEHDRAKANEEPGSNELGPIDFLALNKEFSSK